MIKAYENTVRIDICCIAEGSWNQSRINQEHFSKICQIEINPRDKISPGNVAVREFVDYLEKFIVPLTIEELLQPSDIVGNIRFSHPTLYVFPGGEGDAALFGINGFNMLVDGGFNRKACFWNFVRHLDRLDAVLLTRFNNSNVGGMSGIVQRKVSSYVYPQIGHFFSNLQVHTNKFARRVLSRLGCQNLLRSFRRENSPKAKGFCQFTKGLYTLVRSAMRSRPRVVSKRSG